MRRLLTATLLLLLLLPAARAVAGDNPSDLLIDACRDEKVDGTYSQKTYRQRARPASGRQRPVHGVPRRHQPRPPRGPRTAAAAAPATAAAAVRAARPAAAARAAAAAAAAPAAAAARARSSGSGGGRGRRARAADARRAAGRGQGVDDRVPTRSTSAASSCSPARSERSRAIERRSRRPCSPSSSRSPCCALAAPARSAGTVSSHAAPVEPRAWRGASRCRASAPRALATVALGAILAAVALEGRAGCSSGR